MSYGVVMCSKCNREVHQGNGWYHCEDHEDICVGGQAVYPKSPDELKGKWCGTDSCGMQPEFDIISRPRLWKEHQ
jgi:hypothetical protein